MTQFYKILLALSAVLMAVSFVVFQPVLVAADPVDVFANCSGENSAVCASGSQSGLYAIIKVIINVLLTASGIIAVIMIIVGGIRYVTSNGDQAHVKAAKDTILYAIVGLVITILAFSIVNFVVGKF